MIRLLQDITSADPVTISAKKITFDLNSYDLIFTNSLTVDNNAEVDYIRSGEFKVVYQTSGSAYALSVSNSKCLIKGVEIRRSDANTIYALDCRNATVSVTGDVTAYNTNRLGGGAVGIRAASSSSVTVGGIITAQASTYISLGNSGYKTIADFTEPTTKPGYLTYTDGDSIVGYSTVWVKAAALPSGTAPAISGPVSKTVTAGYAATSTDPYTVTGSPAPTVVKTSGNAGGHHLGRRGKKA